MSLLVMLSIVLSKSQHALTGLKWIQEQMFGSQHHALTGLNGIEVVPKEKDV